MTRTNQANEKALLRARLRELRAAIPPEEKREKDRLIIEKIAASSVFLQAKTLLAYAPREGEIGILPLVRIARERGMRVAFPRCDTARERMTFHYLDEQHKLVRGAYGIFEPPADAPLCIPDEDTLCLLPALALDRSGNRLGYGKGYYDKFLATFPGTTLCAVYHSLLQETLPAEPHDRPVEYLCTEEGILRRASATAKPAKAPASNAFPTRLKTWLLAKTEEGRWAYPTSPLLVLTVYLLLLTVRPIDTYLLNRGNEYLIVILLQILIFILPTVIYLKLRSSVFIQRLRIRPPRLRHTWLCVCALLLMITGGLLCQILTGGIRQLSGNFTLYDAFVARNDGSFGTTLYLVLAYALLPALSEELIFRAVLMADYEKKGMPLAILLSGLFFACLHFDLQFFLTYLLLGMLLAAITFITESSVVAILLHLGYNLFCLFGQPYLSNFYVTAGSHEIFLFCLGTIFLLFAALAAGEARKILHVYAREGRDSSFTEPLPLRHLPRTLLNALLAPAPVACLLVWLTVTLARTF